MKKIALLIALMAVGIINEVAYSQKTSNGIQKAYYDSGKLKAEVTYKNNIPEGSYKFYFESGKLQKIGMLKNDKLEGICKTFFFTQPARIPRAPK